jgi:hypothetical protein
MKKEKVKVKLKDITIVDSTKHYAVWSVLGQYQCYIGKKELIKIVKAYENGQIYKKRLIYRIKPLKT